MNVTPEPASLPSVQPPVAAELVLPPPDSEKKYRLPSGPKMPAAHLYKRAAERTTERREAAGERGAEPVGAAPPPAEPVDPHVPQEVAPPPVPLPPDGDEEVLPDRELNLDGMVPPPLATGKATQAIGEDIRATEAPSQALSHELGAGPVNQTCISKVEIF